MIHFFFKFLMRSMKPFVFFMGQFSCDFGEYLVSKTEKFEKSRRSCMRLCKISQYRLKTAKDCSFKDKLKRTFLLILVIRAFQISLSRFYLFCLELVAQPLLIIMMLILAVVQVLKVAKDKTALKHPPGTRLLAIAEFLYQKETVEGIFAQIVCDWRTDYFDALKEKRKWKARWISIRGHYEFYSAMFKRSPIGEVIETIKMFVK